ncbi:glycosyltransferase [Maridesulfovibrio sp.]|uniref:glycosyltransferase n=1 Tax=Maridesulfovibrio sp. TaxID=2795000 RepID=UPI002A18DC74|nr:glycosyltransferase [Maridesulfovibrio sp.]
MKRLFLINCRQPMVNAFGRLGCEVRSVHSTERYFDVAAKLAELEFVPDIILQQENLGRRVFLTGLRELDCLKIFWSVDTHLNMHWHGLYGSLFDGVLTTQKKYVSRLEKCCEAKIHWMPWMGGHPGPETGTAAGLIPYGKREHDLTFVGRVSPERRARQWFVDFLKSGYNLHLVEGLNYSAMMEVYRQTRVVPNESIFGEVNFRLFEACSCGCAMVTPDAGPELGELFDIGREIMVYDDVLELKEILDRFERDPDYAAMMGLAGYERVMRDHLPDNRAAAILDFAEGLEKRSVSETEAGLLLCLVEAALGEAGDPVTDWPGLIKRLLALPQDFRRDGVLLRIFAVSGLKDLFLDVARSYMVRQDLEFDCYFCMSASLAALKLGMWDIAKHFWYSWRTRNPGEKASVPADEVSLLLLWGDELCRTGNTVRSGVTFNEVKGIPSCAADCYFAALYLVPGSLAVFKKLDAVFSGVKGAEPTRLGFLSHLSLHAPDDWRTSADVGITSLKAFRLTEGMEELKHARLLAAAEGRERFFHRKIGTELPRYFELVSED